MIGKLTGVVDSVGRDTLILDVHGVGYEIICPARLLAKLAVGTPLSVAVETYVREDAIRLFGFANEAERSWFRLLQNVQGVGAKVALAVIGTLAPQELATAIALQDKAQVARAPGVGPKVAARIVIELRDKAPALMAAGGLSMPAGMVAVNATNTSPMADAISALVNLGYGAGDAASAIASASAAHGETANTETLIRAGLKQLAS